MRVCLLLVVLGLLGAPAAMAQSTVSGTPPPPASKAPEHPAEASTPNPTPDPTPAASEPDERFDFQAVVIDGGIARPGYKAVARPPAYKSGPSLPLRADFRHRVRASAGVL